MMQAGTGEGETVRPAVRPDWVARSRQDIRSPYKATTTVLLKRTRRRVQPRDIDRLAYALRLVSFAFSCDATCPLQGVGSFAVPHTVTRPDHYLIVPVMTDLWGVVFGADVVSWANPRSTSLLRVRLHRALRYLSTSNHRLSCRSITSRSQVISGQPPRSRVGSPNLGSR